MFFAPCAESRRDGIDDHFISLLKGARQSIFCSFYELQFARAAEALIERHNAGVDVRIVSDSDYEGRDAIRACIGAGIERGLSDVELPALNGFLAKRGAAWCSFGPDQQRRDCQLHRAVC